ncbi:MAG: hypothetical protein ACLFUW_00280 [Bacteroidales bacterium]
MKRILFIGMTFLSAYGLSEGRYENSVPLFLNVQHLQKKIEEMQTEISQISKNIEEIKAVTDQYKENPEKSFEIKPYQEDLNW